jgi:polyhydroxybutyrate depolymerase
LVRRLLDGDGMRHLRAAAFVAFVSCLSLVTGCRQPQDGTEEASIEVGGRERTYLYHHPPGWRGEPHDAQEKKLPLVIALHGRGGNGTSQEVGTHMTDIANREGFVVVYPDGYRRSWHDARERGPAAEEGIDDVAFVSALIDHFVAHHSVDPTRVFVVGASNGAIMTFRIACELADKIAGAGPVIGLLPDNPAYQCKPSRPVPMMIIAGQSDPMIPYEGGDVLGGDRGKVLSAHATRAKWAELNGCEGADVQQTIDPTPDDGTRVHEMRHSKCKDGAQVVLFTVEGGGHTWPSGDQYLPEAVIGKVSRDMDGSEELWKFFRERASATAE